MLFCIKGCIPSEERLLLIIKREELGLGTRGHIPESNDDNVWCSN